MQKIIEVKSLTKRFGEHIILDYINFEIEEGSIIGIIGKSGCGKTTLLNLLIGFLKPNRGNIYYRGKELNKLGSELGKYIGFASQEGSFYKNLDVVENLTYFGKLYSLSKKEIGERVSILLNSFGLEDAKNTFGGNLSIGMQKRLDIACSLIHDPEILILDEPTANLDPTLRKNILDLVKKINESGTTIILSSHILSDISTLCSKVIVINDKRVVAFDSPKNLEMKFSKTNVIKLESELKDYSAITKVLFENGIVDNYQIEDSSLFLFTNDIKNTLQHINNYYSKEKDNLVYIDISKPSLDMVFEILHGDNKK